MREDLSEDEALANDDLLSDSDPSDEEDPDVLPLLKEGKDNESEGHSSSENEVKFVNPLLKKKTIDDKGEVSEGEWSDDDNLDDKAKKEKKQKK
jgi:hypothetical protein